MRTNLSISDLEAFVAVADNLSFSAAAQALNISPSALSRRIQKLESTLNTELLHRSTREVRLTVAGLQIYSRAQELTNNIYELLDASTENALFARRVVVACSISHSQTFIPRALKCFQTEFPKVYVAIRTLRPTDALDLVRRGIADFGIGDMGLQEAGFDFVPFCRERVVLALPANHRFAGRDSLAWHEVTGEPFIGIVRASPVRVLLDFELARARVGLSPSYEMGNLHAALRCVAEGLGVTATPELTAQVFLPQIALVPLTGPELAVERGLVRAQNRTLRPAAQAFWDCLMAEWKSKQPASQPQIATRGP